MPCARVILPGRRATWEGVESGSHHLITSLHITSSHYPTPLHITPRHTSTSASRRLTRWTHHLAFYPGGGRVGFTSPQSHLTSPHHIVDILMEWRSAGNTLDSVDRTEQVVQGAHLYPLAVGSVVVAPGMYSTHFSPFTATTTQRLVYPASSNPNTFVSSIRGLVWKRWGDSSCHFLDITTPTASKMADLAELRLMRGTTARRRMLPGTRAV